MSCNARERGTYKIPTAAWVGLRKALVDAHNSGAVRMHMQATALYDELKRAADKNRGFDCGEYVRKLIEIADQRRTSYYHSEPSHAQKAAVSWEIKHQMGIDPYGGKVLFSKVKMPRQTMWPLKPARAEEFDGPGWTITLNSKDHTVTYSAEDNHGCLEMHESEPITMAFFKALKAIKWTRGTGGWITYSDEYQRESDYAEDHASTNEAYGPLGEQRIGLRGARRITKRKVA